MINIKRAFDIILTISGFIIGFPIILIIAILIIIFNGTPVFFLQKRPGLKGMPFYIIKFRTMNNKTDVNGNLLPDKQRLTTFGKFLRSTSLDELPELINVLKGDMSLVGPRPLLMEYLDLYSIEQKRRHDVLPGVTGWAQINGRNAMTWDEKFKMDIWYVDNQSTYLDFKIFIITIFKVLVRHGISKEGYATTDNFKGN